MEFNFDPVAFEIFGIEIMWYAIIICIGFILGMAVATKLAKYNNINPDTVIDILLYALPAAIVGARLYYVAFQWDDYKDNLWEILNTRNGGMAIYGGLIGAFLVGAIYLKKKKLSFFKVVDIFMPAIALGQSIGRWGNFINQEAYGVATNLPWGIIINGEKVHPTFLYESLGDFIIFLVLYKICKGNRKFEGQVFSLYLILYGILRFFVEGLRIDSLYIFNFRVSQILSLILVVVGIIIYIIKNKKINKKI
ncbi:prolipoprotein diacylglyceryl transferase [Miniphocaeibacter halophilus]|uniref:Prolipoprotein diacylglyceryl transferase n=1 Tax=Miniphocaeibacter halophilus TaxID=2931922 RepID=A0AC61MT61_9FIRM|nr:prolipoprotein diacylglyceryl transferase [Miniphocaeibacter halophilus]QQK07503.1 prolipoprotein diacylglyceryl transferase [Miniphocaeibacter halophilus]